ncbi:DUF4440 domain-containing protein [Pantoea trifolii]|uniref:DUF4440 domain-containing protein n=1 Tax=Pantoea trifolii TaxID=2968030 RepID=A0ABT1VME5_9GAMM|nr:MULTISPECIES: DUF4440 domain-containing protein [unclassified Pantoea]MCQ8228702.1 DUF4440 domain-containing protein [Pantoea sp. MMK2]MCQ8236875.1 DUF4440 domain-containing protein [Pantoea sp. MMK3]
MLLDKLILLEWSIHGDRRNDVEWLEQLLHPDFREITRSRVMVELSETISSLLSDKTSSSIISSNFRLTGVGEAAPRFITVRLMLTAIVLHYVLPAGCIRIMDNGL